MDCSGNRRPMFGLHRRFGAADEAGQGEDRNQRLVRWRHAFILGKPLCRHKCDSSIGRRVGRVRCARDKPGLPPGPRAGILRPEFAARTLLKIVVAITGASGALYAQRLLDNLQPPRHEVHVILSNYAQVVIAGELPQGLRLTDGVKKHGLKSMNVPFVSGSNPFDAMVVIPCSMGTLGRIAHGTSEDVLLRAADVMLKERKKLILVPRETPLNLVHLRNCELLLQAGAVILPANPSFYSRPATIEDVVDTVVARVLDHLGIAHSLVARWQEEVE